MFHGYRLEVCKIQSPCGAYDNCYTAIIRHSDGYCMKDYGSSALPPAREVIEMLKEQASKMPAVEGFEEIQIHPYEIIRVNNLYEKYWTFCTDTQQEATKLFMSCDPEERCGAWPTYEEADEAAQDYWMGRD